MADIAGNDMTVLDPAAAEELCMRAAIGAGASTETANALARAAVAAELAGRPAVGLAHLVDYLEAMAAGRLDGAATPAISRPVPAIILSDARKGAAHTGFDRCFSDLCSSARDLGIAAFAQRNAFTCGELGYFVRRLAQAGLVGLAATNGPALLAGSGSTRPVYCTNPLAFAAPAGSGPPLVIDQASSATAFVNIRRAAAEGRPIPADWAIDEHGAPTTDAAAAMRGALVAFGGERGANVALMVEVLAAGLGGANWSLDAPSFHEGSRSPGSGLFVLAINPLLFDADFEERLGAQLQRLESDHGVHVPGRRAPAPAIAVSARLRDRIESFVDRAD